MLDSNGLISFMTIAAVAAQKSLLQTVKITITVNYLCQIYFYSRFRVIKM